MRISELITKLQYVQSIFGDLPCVAYYDSTANILETEFCCSVHETYTAYEGASYGHFVQEMEPEAKDKVYYAVCVNRYGW